ncbi:M20 family metallopeptidase [Priestia megaterium]|jgi:amidohydrolase|uniref:M20 family metallopeptidase n=1 Tax=Priestia megaterium TaxID=1404 RepID=UPI001866FAF5|nr:M20 family metallopeptidase [Priestia megaterium]MBE2977410.1 M20 family metallopeptidase [Priestia megaterium]MBT2255769.1 M20 family metallopeptidase [Priestia megaterium]MBT2279144.1 M20 family metallopeptidase [Priestia megaterium]MCY9019256.1 M20 family metallopeptidase [Priestia megaterium]MCY9022061.1 M20 family metallopeptidase [Priestia megaterium]
MKQLINETINNLQDTFYDVSKYIGQNPELGHEEFKACKALTDVLKEQGFTVEIGTCDLPTAFTAVYDSQKPGPSIGFMAEYDALPDLGHACGHNLIGTMSIAAGIGLSKAVAETGGKVYVYGTPAEETRGGKVTMAEQGIFNHLDVAMMVHPYYCHQKSGRSLAMDAIQFEFFGKSAHAAAAPHEGINALDGVLQTFNSINALRQHVKPDVRIHGVITEGGKAANVVPDYAVAQFYVRASTRAYVDEVTEKVKACANGAALATGTKLKISNYEFSYDDMQTNQTLSDVYTNNLISLGVSEQSITEDQGDHGSLDMGNVSQVVPAIHPYIQICDDYFVCHTHEFREAALSEQGREAMILGAQTMALTGYDVLTNQALLQKIKEEFNATK